MLYSLSLLKNKAALLSHVLILNFSNKEEKHGFIANFCRRKSYQKISTQRVGGINRIYKELIKCVIDCCEKVEDNKRAFFSSINELIHWQYVGLSVWFFCLFEDGNFVLA